LTVAMLTNFSIPFTVSSVNIAVPHIGTEFNASATSLSWIVLSFLIVTVVLAIPFGRIADIYRRTPILKLGIFLVCLSAVLNIFAPSMEAFLLLRIMQGVGSAMIFATNIALLVGVFPASERGKVLGVSISAVYTGASVGPFVGGQVIQYFGWRALFVVIAAIALAAFIMAMVRLPKESKKEGKEELNLHGIIFHVARLFSGNRAFTLSNLAGLFNYASIFAIIYFMSIYLQLGRGWSAGTAGLIVIAQPAVQIVLSPIAGRLSDKRPPAIIASIGMALCACALFMLSFLGEQTSVPYIVAGLIVAGTGVALFVSPNSNMVYGSVSSDDYSVAASVISTSRTFGQVIGTGILTVIISAVIGSVPIQSVEPAGIIRSMQVSFWVFSAVCVAGVFISLSRREKERGSK